MTDTEQQGPLKNQRYCGTKQVLHNLTEECLEYDQKGVLLNSSQQETFMHKKPSTHCKVC